MLRSAALTFILAIAPHALAQEPAPEPAAPAVPPAAAPEPAPAPPPEAPITYGEPAVHERPGYPAVEPTYERAAGHGAYTHDGFYLRLGLGLGWSADSIESNDDGFTIPSSTRGDRGAFTATLSGLVLATEVAIGGTPSPGLVVGGGVFSHILTDASSSSSQIGDDNLPGASLDRVVFVVFGVMADYYFDPRGGFHVQGALGLGQVLSGAGQWDDADARTFAGAHSATGPGLVLGMGYEWFIAGQWSAGILLRAAGAISTGGDDRKLEWTHTIVVPALLATVTHH